MKKNLLLLISLLYLIAEIIFNVSLVNVFGTGTIEQYVNIELIGRNLASVGATLLLLRLILNINTTIKKKTIASVLALPLIYIVAYNAQEQLIDYIAKSTDTDVKRQQAYASLFTKGVTNGAIDIKTLSNKSIAPDSPKGTVIKASTITWGVLSPEYMGRLLKKDSEIVKEINDTFHIDFINNNKRYYKDYKIVQKEVHSLYSKYSQLVHEVLKKEDNLKAKIDLAWLKKKSEEERLVKRYTNAKRKIKRLETITLRGSKSSPSTAAGIVKAYRALGDCKSQSCVSNIKNELSSLSRDIPFDYNIANSCTFGMSGRRNTINFNSIQDVKPYGFNSNYNRFSDYQTIHCVVNIVQIEEYQLKDVYSKVKNESGISDFSPRNADEFRRSKSLDIALSDITYKLAGVKLPQKWKSNNKDLFYRSFIDHYIGDVDNVLKDTMIKTLGFYAPKALSHSKFYENYNVKSFINKNVGIFGSVTFNKDIYTQKDFLAYYSDTIGRDLGVKYLTNMQNEEFYTEIFKKTLAPVVAIIFSLIFSVINLSFILKDLTLKLVGNKYRSSSSYIFLAFLFILNTTPLIYSSVMNGTEYIKEMNKTDSKGLFSTFTYAWFIETETALYSLGEALGVEPELVFKKY
jgi:hypothetical protein